MIRRLVLAMCLLGVIGGGASTAIAASGPVSTTDHQICVVLAKDDHHQRTQDYCINYG
ncbi:MAG: hypothetical protein JO222_11305 [Frankiales bacterium]|nr:hypothetical protein [Frankiales bacterium]